VALYWSTNVCEAVGVAHAELELHLLDPASGLCRACGRDAPCGTANDAVNYLLGAGESLPTARPEPAAGRRWRWRPSLRECDTRVPRVGLLTHGWRVKFGLDVPAGSASDGYPSAYRGRTSTTGGRRQRG
jgi:hypothetical protein